MRPWSEVLLRRQMKLLENLRRKKERRYANATAKLREIQNIIEKKKENL